MLTKLDLLEPVHFLKPAVAKMTDSGKKTCSDSAILRGRRRNSTLNKSKETNRCQLTRERRIFFFMKLTTNSLKLNADSDPGGWSLIPRIRPNPHHCCHDATRAATRWFGTMTGVWRSLCWTPGSHSTRPAGGQTWAVRLSTLPGTLNTDLLAQNQGFPKVLCWKFIFS